MIKRRTTEHWYDLLYAVTFTVHDAWVKFEAVRLASPDAPPLYIGVNHPVDDLSVAEVEVRGSMKWDGCANFTAESVHTCDREGIERFGLMLARVHDRAGDLLAGGGER